MTQAVEHCPATVWTRLPHSAVEVMPSTHAVVLKVRKTT